MQELSFGPFSLDVPAGRLLRDGADVRLRPQAFHALHVLAARRGDYVDHERLMADAWKGIVVSRHTVDVTVAEVRKALQEYGSWIRRRGTAGYCLEVPASDALVRRGWHFCRLRSRKGFDSALDCFQQAGTVCADDFRAFEGQAACYLLLAAYGLQPGSGVRQPFEEAHGRAERLAGLTPELRCMRAQAFHMLDRCYAEAEAEFLHAIAERPRLALAHVGLANLYVTLGRLEEASACASRAREIDPLLPIVLTIDVAVRFWRREYGVAAELGAKAVELHPHFLLGRAFYAHALEYEGRLAEALEQYQIGQVISQDLPWVRAYEGICLVKLGREREARALLADLQRQRRRAHVDPYALALFLHAIGRTDEAFTEIDRAIDERCATTFCVGVDPRAAALRADERFGGRSASLGEAGGTRQAS